MQGIIAHAGRGNKIKSCKKILINQAENWGNYYIVF